VLRSCTVTSPISNTIRVLCDFLGASQQISVNTTCTSCEGIQPPVTITGNIPLDISDILPENYTVEVIAVDANNRRLENNSIAQMVSVSTSMYLYIISINTYYH